MVGMRIAVHYDPTRAQYFEILLRLRPEVLSGFEIKLVDMSSRPVDMSQFDGLIAHGKFITQSVVDAGKPIVLAERRDSSILFDRRFVHAPNLIAIWKIAVGAWSAQTSGHERWHVHLLKPDQRPTLQSIPDRVRGLLHPVHGYGAYKQMQRWLPWLYSDAKGVRRHSIHFRGKVQYKNAPEVSQHRLEATWNVKLVGGLAGGRVDRGMYEREMLESRMCLSAWGYGELCWRDYEAICAGCLLVKPASDYVETWPRLFESGVTYVACRPDFSDLGEVVEKALAQPALAKQIICESRERLRQALEPSRLLAPFAPTLRKLASMG